MVDEMVDCETDIFKSYFSLSFFSSLTTYHLISHFYLINRSQKHDQPSSSTTSHLRTNISKINISSLLSHLLPLTTSPSSNLSHNQPSSSHNQPSSSHHDQKNEDENYYLSLSQSTMSSSLISDDIVEGINETSSERWDG